MSSLVCQAFVNTLESHKWTSDVMAYCGEVVDFKRAGLQNKTAIFCTHALLSALHSLAGGIAEDDLKLVFFEGLKFVVLSPLLPSSPLSLRLPLAPA